MWRHALPSDSVPLSVAEAESSGRRFPRSAGPVEFSALMQSKVVVGTSARRCVAVGKANAAQSGDFIVVSLRHFADEWRRGILAKTTWVTAHRARIGRPMRLTVRASRLDPPDVSYIFVGAETTYSWAATLLMRFGWSRGAFIPLPTAGKWLLVATVAQDWGCFVQEL